MELEYPKSILICHDDYHAKHIGKTIDGNQFFLTTPFVAATESEGCEFIALYIFDSDGSLISSQIEDLGPRSALSEDIASEKYNSILNGLGEVSYQDINISPFQVEKFGVQFGLIPTDPEFVEEEGDMALEMHPGNVMAFYPPWEGDYDT